MFLIELFRFDLNHSVGGYLMNRMSKFLYSIVLFALVSVQMPMSAGLGQSILNGSKSTINVLGKPLIYALNHKIMTALSALSAGALYLAYTRADTKEWPVIKESQNITDFLHDPTAMPAEKLHYWKIHKWETAGDIIANKDQVYKDFKLEKMNGDRTEIAFIDRMSKEIDGEKGKLNTLLKSLAVCLAECKILPRIELTKHKEFDWIAQLIKKEKKRFGIIQENENVTPLLHELTPDQIKAIGYEVQKGIKFSLLKPHRLVRHFIFPSEFYAIQEVWKIRQLIARLDALQSCLIEKRRSINQAQLNQQN